MTVEKALQQLEELQRKIYALQYAEAAISLDAVTVAPPDTAKGRSLAQGVISGYLYPLFSGKETGDLLTYLTEHKEELTPLSARQVEELQRKYDEIHRMPEEEYTAYSMLLNDAQDVWHKAKAQDDYQAFAPYLERIIEANRKKAAYMDESQPPYDVLIGSGLLGRCGDYLAALLGQRKIAVLTDDTVAPLYLDALTGSLRAAGFRTACRVVPSRSARASWLSPFSFLSLNSVSPKFMARGLLFVMKQGYQAPGPLAILWRMHFVNLRLRRRFLTVF